jgi:uncharacterized protein with PIN domain
VGYNRRHGGEVTVTIRFYEELNHFLPPDRRKRDYQVTAPKGSTVKKIIEDQGVPHTEVDLVLVNGASEDFSYKLEPGDRLSVYPVFESFDIAAASRVRPQPLREVRFILDVHLGKLAGLLRMLGFDALYSNSAGDDELARISGEESRILLTRDRELLKRKIVTHGYFVRSRRGAEQAAEIVRRFQLQRLIRPFTRCLRCNVPLHAVDPVDVSGKVPVFVEQNYRIFHRCPVCGRLYWKGTHWQRMKERIEALISRHSR